MMTSPARRSLRRSATSSATRRHRRAAPLLLPWVASHLIYLDRLLRSFAVTLQRWVEFVRHEDRREDHSVFCVLRGREQTIPRAAPSTHSCQDRQRRRQTEFEATNGLEMKCFNEDGLNVDRRCTKRHPNQRRGAN